MKSKSQDQPYQDKFVEDLDAHSKKVLAICRCLEAVATGSPYNASTFTDVCKALPAVTAVQTELVNHGCKFGFTPAIAMLDDKNRARNN